MRTLRTATYPKTGSSTKAFSARSRACIVLRPVPAPLRLYSSRASHSKASAALASPMTQVLELQQVQPIDDLTMISSLDSIGGDDDFETQAQKTVFKRVLVSTFISPVPPAPLVVAEPSTCAVLLAEVARFRQACELNQARLQAAPKGPWFMKMPDGKNILIPFMPMCA